MHFNEWWHLLQQQVSETDIWQWLAVALAVAEVLLARADNIWLYPAGIASTLISVYILLLAGLYAESALNGYYVVMSVYGWWYWARRKNHAPVMISWCDRKDWINVLAITMGSFLLLYFLLSRFTSSTVPLWDSWVSATAWAGMWLLAKRKTENWILLNISNAFAIPLLFYKRLPLFALLTVFLFIVAIKGYMDWSKSYRKNQIVPENA